MIGGVAVVAAVAALVDDVAVAVARAEDGPTFVNDPTDKDDELVEVTEAKLAVGVSEVVVAEVVLDVAIPVVAARSGVITGTVLCNTAPLPPLPAVVVVGGFAA